MICYPQPFEDLRMEVSWNRLPPNHLFLYRGTPPVLNQPFWGTSIYGNPRSSWQVMYCAPQDRCAGPSVDPCGLSAAGGPSPERRAEHVRNRGFWCGIDTYLGVSLGPIFHGNRHFDDVLTQIPFISTFPLPHWLPGGKWSIKLLNESVDLHISKTESIGTKKRKTTFWIGQIGLVESMVCGWPDHKFQNHKCVCNPKS